MHPHNRTIRLFALAGLAGLAACADSEGPLAAPIPQAEPVQLAALACTADIRSGTVSCVDDAGAAGASRDIIIGGQNRYVALTSSNVTVTNDSAAAGSFDFDVTVRNLIPQAIGTTDGTRLDPSGVRVFFARPPMATAGSGEVRVTNAQLATFTGTEPQPFFQYNELLAPNQTSGALRWQLDFDAGVESFSFAVYVSAPVRYPLGWVELGPNDQIDLGTTRQLTPVVLTAVGDTVRGTTITWTSSDTTTVVVDGNGLVSTVRPGNATVTATSVGDTTRLGSITLGVCATPAVGQVVEVTNQAASNLCISAGASAGEYTLMPINQWQSSALTMSVLANNIGDVTGPPSPNLAPNTGALLGLSTAAALRDDALDMRLREWARSTLGPKMRNPAARVTRATAGGARRAITPGVPTVGQLMTLNVAGGCNQARDDRTGRVVSVKQSIVIVADTANPAGGFTPAQYDSIALEFDTIAYAVDTTNFGAPADIDGNARVVAFFTRAVNERPPPATVSAYGYFDARDLFSTGASGCALSNAGEILYMLVPDITGSVNGNARTVAEVRGNAIVTMGHEMQHLINASRRMYVNGAIGFAERWFDEALSGIAEELMFYRTAPGLAPRQNIDLASLATGPNASRRMAAFNSYANPNFARVRGWLQHPEAAGPFDPSPVLVSRGAGWAFLRYAADRVNGNEPAFWRSLVNGQYSGLAALESATGADSNQWLRDFTTAMYTDDAVAGMDGKYTLPSWNYRSVFDGLGGFPLLTRPLTSGSALTLSYWRGGATAYTRFGVAAGARGTVAVTTAGARLPGTAAVVLVRTR